ncbi:MAG: hypothetical protein DMG21_10140 [Acidobacteria bacterium]|nr:MAG: hypothetical protein DMG21_10140 [Acidobacteriota bacterium]
MQGVMPRTSIVMPRPVRSAQGRLFAVILSPSLVIPSEARNLALSAQSTLRGESRKVFLYRAGFLVVPQGGTTRNDSVHVFFISLAEKA